MKWSKTIYYVFLGLVILIAILLVVSIFPITGNYKVMVVQSGSMAPAIKMGSIVVVKPMKDYKIGEVITFGPTSRTKSPFTHRIFDIKVVAGQPVYVTKGDANDASDPREISQKEIIGKVLFDVPYIGYAVGAAKKPIGFLLIIIIPALLIVVDELSKIWKELKNQKLSASNRQQASNSNG